MQPPADISAPEAQKVLAPLTTAAIFLVVTIEPGEEGDAAMRAMGEAIGALVRSIGFRHLEGELSCVMGIGSAAWDRDGGAGAPRSLGRAPCIRFAPSKPGRGLRRPLRETSCSTFAPCASICASSWREPFCRQLGSSVSTADEVHGFRYFEARDLLGFVDGTENPVGDAMAEQH